MNENKQSGQDHDEDKPLEELLAEMESAEVGEAVEIDIDTLFTDISISAHVFPYRMEAATIIHRGRKREGPAYSFQSCQRGRPVPSPLRSAGFEPLC